MTVINCRMKQVVLLLTCLLATFCSYDVPTGCTPYGVRLALGLSYYTSNQSENLSIWFNTRLQCPKSYISFLKQSSSIRKIYCSSKKVAFNTFQSFVHRCSIDNISRGDKFEYNAFGWTGSASDPQIPFKPENIKSYLLRDDEPVKMLILADWSYLSLKSGVYDRLDQAFSYLLSSVNHPNLIVLNGDYAYDFSTNNGLNYDNFMIMLSQISSVWPCILNTGNHEYKTENDKMLFKSSFQLYDLGSKNVTTINLGAFSLVMMDPYGFVYDNVGKQQLLSQFKRNLDKTRKNKPIITASHYPLACSGAVKDCSQIKIKLKQFFDAMIDYNTVLYLGSHYHTYERTYPYQKSGNFVKIPSPYTLTKSSKYLVSIVEGIAGNDKAIVESYKKIMDYTAALSYKQTGFGIMTIDSRKLVFQHFKATSWNKSEDFLSIDFTQLFAQSYLREE